MTEILERGPGEAPIVITREEANSRHVDDLLKRQMSLRGEGITAEPARRWYYQSWLLFMIVGAIAAFIAWLLIEPSFDDYHYVQGTVESINLEDGLTLPGSQNLVEQGEIFGQGWAKVRGQKIWFYPIMRELEGGRAGRAFDPTLVKQGQDVGLYVSYYTGGREDLAIAHFIMPSPAGPASGKGTVPLRDQAAASETSGFLMFSVVAGLIGLGIGATDGIVCRLPRRALLGGLVGALVGAVGGLFSNVLANVFYAPMSSVAAEKIAMSSAASRALGFFLQMVARMLAWALAGMAAGLGQGITLRSKRLLTYGFLGGVIGGLLGGLLFDPIDIVILGGDRVGAEASRAIGLTVIGAAVGAMIGVVELLARDIWLRMTEGPLAGKEFLIFRDVMNIGASPRSEIYLFNDGGVAPTHAQLRVIGDETEIAARDRLRPVLVNGHGILNARLRHGDRITIGSTSFVFEQRQR